MDIIVSFYKFKKLFDLKTLKEDIFKLAEKNKLKGTVLLAKEGINASIAGEENSVRAFLEALKSDTRIGEFFEEKANPAYAPTHRRLLVKIKEEIVTMRHGDFSPEEDTGNYLSPEEFKKWCDDGKKMILVDTRNDYEVALGKFKGALDPDTKSFSEFPEWVEKNLSDAKDETIVTYCTGGIRCEKATAYMKQEGFQKVYQIKGGILQYFEDLAKEGKAPHWEGDCIVFDKRLAVAPDLDPTEKELCFNCLVELHEQNRVDQEYKAGFLCNSCHTSYENHREKRELEGKQKAESFRKRRHENCLKEREKWEKIKNSKGDKSSAL